jgi:secreted PhoX family phosphatase
MRNSPSTSTLVGDPSRAYDTKGGGGTTTLDVRVRRDGERELVRHHLSLNGTIVNCAGGETPWGSWITCEETTAGTTAGWLKPHGYCFDVSARADGLVQAKALPALGRFSHEAITVDPNTWIVYETEDQTFTPGDPPRGSGFYRFVPRRRGDLERGKLQMLAIRGQPNYNTSTGQTPFAHLPQRRGQRLCGVPAGIRQGRGDLPAARGVLVG